MKSPQCMGRDNLSSDGICFHPGEFRIKDSVTSGDDDGWSYFCDVHIGDHLHHCYEGFESTGNKVKTVILKLV